MPIILFELLVLGLAVKVALEYFHSIRTLHRQYRNSLAYILLRDSVIFPLLWVLRCKWTVRLIYFLELCWRASPAFSHGWSFRYDSPSPLRQIHPSWSQLSSLLVNLHKRSQPCCLLCLDADSFWTWGKRVTSHLVERWLWISDVDWNLTFRSPFCCGSLLSLANRSALLNWSINKAAKFMAYLHHRNINVNFNFRFLRASGVNYPLNVLNVL